MGRFSLSRRSLIGAGAAGVAAFGLPRARMQAWAQPEIRLRMFWWGSKERAERTEKANLLFQQRHPGIALAGETLGWTDYWPRLATQAAGRNVADILQMDYRYIFEYARRGALLALDPLVPKPLKLDDFGAAAIDSGKVDGKVYGVSLGLNSTALMYDKATIEALGLPTPTWEMTWAELGALAVEITKAAKRSGFTGLQDAGRFEPALEVWLRQRGKALYRDDATLGFDAADMADWFALWNDLRQRGGCAAPETQAMDMGEIDSSLLTLGKAAIVFAHSNQLVGYQALNKSRLAMTTYPNGGAGSRPGQYLKPAMLWSVSARTRQADAAAQVVDFYANDRDAGLILGVERGVPPSRAMRTAVEPTLDPLGQAMTRYVSFVTDKVGPLPAPPPAGAGEVQAVLRRVNEQIGFGRLSVGDGAKQFVKEAKAALARG